MVHPEPRKLANPRLGLSLEQWATMPRRSSSRCPHRKPAPAMLSVLLQRVRSASHFGERVVIDILIGQYHTLHVIYEAPPGLYLGDD
jgi:hypothetical protein